MSIAAIGRCALAISFIVMFGNVVAYEPDPDAGSVTFINGSRSFGRCVRVVHPYTKDVHEEYCLEPLESWVVDCPIDGARTLVYYLKFDEPGSTYGRVGASQMCPADSEQTRRVNI